jgi:glycosyltransferase involved in cell wall biosynthesis
VRILLFTSAASPGGLHRHLRLLAEGLARAGHAVGVALPPGPGADPLAAACAAAGASVSRLEVAGKTDVSGASALRALVAATAADVVHVHLASPVEALPALLAIRAGGARRLVTTEHAPTWFPLRRPWSRTAKRLVGGGVDAVIAVSAADARFLREEFGVPARKLHVVHNGVELTGYDLDRTEARRACRLETEDGFLVGYLGALEEKKGIEDLLAAAETSGVPQMRVALAGEGSLIGRLSGRCLLLGHLADPRPFLRALDAFAFPSHQEALPFAVLEAMAAARPVVASRVGGIPEAVEDGVSGLLVEAGDRRALGASLRTLAADPGLARRLGEAGRARVERAFSAARMVEETLAVYRGLDRKASGPML